MGRGQALPHRLEKVTLRGLDDFVLLLLHISTRPTHFTAFHMKIIHFSSIDFYGTRLQGGYSVGTN